MKGRCGKRKSARLESQQAHYSKTEVKAEGSQEGRRIQHVRAVVPRPSAAIANDDDNVSLPSGPDSSKNAILNSLHELMLKSIDKVERLADRTSESHEDVVGLQTQLVNLVGNHDRRIDSLEDRVRVIEQTGRGNEIPVVEAPDPVELQAPQGRAICFYCQKNVALSYVYTHHKRYHANEMRRNSGPV